MRMIEIQFERDVTFTDEQLQAINNAIVWGVDEIAFYEGKVATWNKYLVDKDLMPNVPYNIIRVIGETALLDVAIDKRVPMVNEKVNVIVPGLGLLTLNQVVIMADCCTELLNEKLLAGWRIVAVCPQPDQRRPDYVLGRSFDGSIS